MKVQLCRGQSSDGRLCRASGNTNSFVSAQSRRGRVQDNDPLYNNLIDLNDRDRGGTDNSDHVEQQSIDFNHMTCMNRAKCENNTLSLGMISW